MKLNLSNDKTTNVQLIQYAKHFGIQLTILMNDQFKLPKPGYYILNLENSGLDGSHWVCVICDKRQCFYFDSYGAVPTKNVELRLKEKYGKIYMNNLIIQSLRSNMCGMYCLGLIIYVHQHPKTELITACDQYLNMFSDDEEQNNKILRQYFKSLQ